MGMISTIDKASPEHKNLKFRYSHLKFSSALTKLLIFNHDWTRKSTATLPNHSKF